MANVQIDSMTDTWNSGGTTFNAIKMNVTDTASAAASKLIDLQVGGNTKANVTKAGLLTLASGVTLTGANTLQTTTGALTLVSGSSNIVLTPSSNVGIGTTGPDKKLDVLDASAAQLRLTHTDGSVYTDFQTLSTGHQLMTTSGGNRITSTTVNDTSVLARQVQGGLAFDGVTTTEAASFAISSVTTSDISISITILVPTSASTTYPIVQLKTSNTKTTEVSSFVLSIVSGSLVAQLIGPGATTDWNKATLASFVTNYGGKLVNIVFTRSSTTDTLYVNGVPQTLTETTNGTAPTWAGSIASLYAYFGAQDSTYFSGPIFSATLFNRALSASEVITLANQGVQEPDKWGSLTTAYESTFAAGVTSGYAAVNGTTTGILGPIDGRSNVLEMDSGAGTSLITQNTATTFTAGKRYRVSFYLYIPVANVLGTSVNIRTTGNTSWTSALNATPTKGVWTQYNLEGVNPSALGLRFILRAGLEGSSTITAGDKFYIDDLVVTEIGSILDADLSAGVGYQVPDRSSNKYHGVVSASGTSWTLAQRRGQLRVSSNTNGNQQLLGSQVCLPTNAIITSIVGYTTGTPTVYIGNVSGGSQIVASVAMSASTYQSFTLVANNTTTGNLWVNASSSATINWTITYMIVDP